VRIAKLNRAVTAIVLNSLRSIQCLHALGVASRKPSHRITSTRSNYSDRLAARNRRSAFQELSRSPLLNLPYCGDDLDVFKWHVEDGSIDVVVF
jgi:hypothetical protein